MTRRTEAEAMPDQVAQLRVPPQSIEAECSVLGALLLDNRVFDRVGDVLTDADFYRYEHRLIYAAITELITASRPADTITVFENLQSSGKGESVGGLAYLGELATYIPSPANARRYAEIVREHAVLRGAITVADEIATAAFNPQGRPVATILDDAMQRILRISSDVTKDDWESMEEIITRELDMIQERADGQQSNRPAEYTPTGLADFDEIMDGGLRGGQLIYIGARPGMGKTAMARTIGLHVAHDGKAVGSFTMEMQNREAGQMSIAGTAQVPLHKIRRPERMGDVDWGNLSRGIDQLRPLPFYSNERGGLNINQLRAQARSLHRRHRLGLLIVDYLQLMSGTDPRMQRTYQLEEASRGLKSLAKELSIPIICLAQVNRGVEKESDPMPRLSDLKDCGAIEQDADAVLFLHREIVTKPDLADEWKPYCKALLAKQRGGRTGYLHFQYIAEQLRFTDWPVDVDHPKAKVTAPKQSKGMQ